MEQADREVVYCKIEARNWRLSAFFPKGQCYQMQEDWNA